MEDKPKRGRKPKALSLAPLDTMDCSEKVEKVDKEIKEKEKEKEKSPSKAKVSKSLTAALTQTQKSVDPDHLMIDLKEKEKDKEKEKEKEKEKLEVKEREKLEKEREKLEKEKEKEKKEVKKRKPKAVYEVGSQNATLCTSDDEHIILKLNVNLDAQQGDDIDAEPMPYDQPNQLIYSELKDDLSLSLSGSLNEKNQNQNLKGDCLQQCPESLHAQSMSQTKARSKPDGLKVIELLKDFEEKNKINEWPQTTSIHCYWCCHRFDNTPVGIPVKLVDQKFFVVGCYCSLDCAMAYNIHSRESNIEIWERHNLINLLAKKLGVENVKPSPTRLALSMFGGHLSIEEFRSFSQSNKLINVNFPPMMTLTQQIEEINESDVNNDYRYIPVDTDRINRYKEKIHLKRSKPVNLSENTLDMAMNLKFG